MGNDQLSGRGEGEDHYPAALAAIQESEKGTLSASRKEARRSPPDRGRDLGEREMRWDLNSSRISPRRANAGTRWRGNTTEMRLCSGRLSRPIRRFRSKRCSKRD